MRCLSSVPGMYLSSRDSCNPVSDTRVGSYKLIGSWAVLAKANFNWETRLTRRMNSPMLYYELYMSYQLPFSLLWSSAMVLRLLALSTWVLCAIGAVLEENQKRDYCQQYSYYSQVVHEPFSEGTNRVLMVLGVSELIN